MARRAPCGAARPQGRRCARRRRRDVQGQRDRAAGARNRERTARDRAAPAAAPRRRARDEPVAARQPRRLSIARRGPHGARRARSLSHVAAGGVEVRPADGEHPRSAARGAPDARARGTVPRTRRAGRGDPRGRRGRPRGIALPAAPSRHRRHAPLLRCAAAPGAHAVRAAVRRARRLRKRGGHRIGARGAEPAGGAADFGGARRAAAAGIPARGDRLRHRRAAAVRLRVAAADCARERAAAARAAARPAAPASGRDRRLRAGRRRHRAADRLAGAGREGGRDHDRRHRRAARRRGAHGVAPDRRAEAPAATRRDVALRSCEPAPAAARLEPAGGRAGARLHGAPAPHRRARRPDAELAGEPARRMRRTISC